ncbi:MAG: transcriptional regulator [Pyrinomonadaceae bacterium]
MSNKINHLYRFGDYVLNVKEKNLWLQDELVQIPPKVFDTLLILVERHGQVISKEEMLDRIWTDSIVEENNLSQNISALRRLFGKNNKFIETVPRKGFRFIKPVVSASISNDKNTNLLGNGHLSHAITGSYPMEDIATDGNLKTGQFSEINPLKNSSRNLTLVFVLAFLLTAAVGFFIYSFVGSSQSQKSKTPFASFDYKELTDTGGVGSSAISPDGKFVVFVKESSDKRLTNTSLHLMNIGSRSETQIKIDGDIEANFVQFSPMEIQSIFAHVQILGLSGISIAFRFWAENRNLLPIKFAGLSVLRRTEKDCSIVHSTQKKRRRLSPSKILKLAKKHMRQ